MKHGARNIKQISLHDLSARGNPLSKICLDYNIYDIYRQIDISHLTRGAYGIKLFLQLNTIKSAGILLVFKLRKESGN